MGFWQPEVFSVALPKAIWPLMSLGIVLAAEIAAVLSLAFLQIVFPFSFNESNLILFLITVPLVGLVVGLRAWWQFVVRPRQTTLRRGIFLGILSGITAHPLVWICCTLLSSLLGRDFIIHQTEPDLLSNLLSVIPFSAMSLILVGWITAIVGGSAGGLLVYLQIVLTRRMHQRDDTVSLPNG